MVDAESQIYKQLLYGDQKYMNSIQASFPKAKPVNPNLRSCAFQSRDTRMPLPQLRNLPIILPKHLHHLLL
jgi:hypothetical protein